MLMKLKGLLRRMLAGVTSLSRTSVAALVGIVALAAVVAVIVLLSAGMSSSFTVKSASAQEPESVVIVPADEEADVEPALVMVHVGGCVVRPGVYELPEGSRLLAFVDAAGGMTEDANADGVNLARIVRDGEHIVIPARGETGDYQSIGVFEPTMVSINAADAEELCTLDGIGAVLAKRIIAYRERIGGFTSLAQLMDVSGIGQKRYEAIKDAICL